MSTIKRERLVDQAYEVLRSRILSRKLLPGQRLSVPTLADELDTSRSPIREAVQRLVNEGLATERPNHGAVVASPDLNMLAELYQLRAPLEGLAAALMTKYATPLSVVRLKGLLVTHRTAFESGDVDGVIRADLDFHLCIAKASGNEQLVRTLDPIFRRVTIAMLAGKPETWPARAIEEHAAIVEAIQAGDEQVAREMAERHVQLVRERILDSVGESGAVAASGSGGADSLQTSALRPRPVSH